VSPADSDRDRAIDQLLRRARPRASAERSDLCLDAETLARWIDRDLGPADVAAAEAHVAGCARCQAVVAAMVRATPATETRAAWWRRPWVVGSLVPLTAGAIGLAIWIARPEEKGRAPIDRVSVQTPAVTAAPQAAAPPPPALPTQPLRTPSQRQVKPAPAERIEARALNDAGSPAPATPQETRDTAESARRDRAVAAPAAAPPPAAPLRPELARAAALSKQAMTPTEIASPDPAVRWRIGPAGSIEHSTNSGATWERLSSGVSDDLTAGSATSPITVWIVGRAGTVLLSTDGRQWRRVSFPERADLVTVRAEDALIASVTTADGRTFRTSDGGQTWPPLQEF